MKRTAFLIITATLVSLATVNIFAMSNDVTEVRVGQKACDEESGIEIEFVRVVEDSRCPEGVDCIWAGRAVIEVKAHKAGESSDIKTLSTNGDDGSFEFAGYRIHLERVDPYPKEASPIAEDAYKAAFKIEKE